MPEPREWVQVVVPYDAATFDLELNAGRMKRYMQGNPLARQPSDVDDVEVVSITTRTLARGEVEGTIRYRLIE